MADECNDCKVSLKSSMKTISSGNEYIGTLNVPNFFTLPEYNGIGFDMKSPSFECANETWRLNFHRTYSSFFEKDSRSFDVNLLKKDSNIGQQAAICTIDLLDANGKTYHSRSAPFLVNREDNDDEDDGDNDYEDHGDNDYDDYSDNYYDDYGDNYYDDYGDNYYDDYGDNDNEDDGYNDNKNDGDNDDSFYIGSFTNKKPSYDTRDTLTLIIHLRVGKSFVFHFSVGESFNVITDQIPLRTDAGNQTCHLDAEILSQDFKKLFLNGKNQDLTLRVADKEFRVHQDILMARSKVFEAMLTHDMTENNKKGVIDVPDCNPEAMEQFLLYVYSGKVETLNQDNMFGLYYAADKYQMIPLKEECSKFIKQSISVSVFCEVIQLALNHSDTELLECATKYFLNHVNEILPTVQWMSFMKSNTIAANELFIKVSSKCDCEKSKKL